MNAEPDPIFFETSSDLRDWLEHHHDRSDVLWVGFHKKATGRPSITWPELVDELLCYGWIDGLRRSIDEERWMIRVTPRRPRSRWSEVNLRRFAELRALGRVTPPGLVAFERFEHGAGSAATGSARPARPAAVELSPELVSRLEANGPARAYFDSETESYRRTVSRWVMSAKREETRLRRLERLIEDSAAGRRIKEMRR